MNRSQAASALALAGIAIASLLVSSCDPPGKPSPIEAQNENRNDITDFATLFQSNCSGCHGNYGEYGAARPIHDALYLAVIPRQALHDVIEYGRTGTSMPAWAQSQGGPLTEKQVNILVDGIYKNWSKPQQFAGQKLPAYAGEGGSADNGKKLFARDCFMCHAKGGAVGVIADPTYTSLASDQYIRSMIITGRMDLGMPNYRALGMGHPLTDTDIADLTAYVSSFRPAAITAQMRNPGNKPGEQTGAIGTTEDVNGPGTNGPQTKGNEGSGNGPGSPRPTQRSEGNKGKGSSSQQGVK